MVQQTKIVRVDIIFLNYNRMRSADRPAVKLDSTCLAGPNEIRKHRALKRRQKAAIGNDAYKHYKWYNTILMAEAMAAGENAKLRILHWHIESGHKAAFKVNGLLYGTVSLVIGSELEHWYCANVGSSMTAVCGSHSKVTLTPSDALSECIRNPNIDLQKWLPHCDSNAFSVSEQTYLRCKRDYCANNCVECANKPPTSECLCYYQTNDNHELQNPIHDDLIETLID